MMRRFLMISALFLAAATAAPLEARAMSAQVDTTAVAGEPTVEMGSTEPITVAQEAPMLPRLMRPFYHVFAAFALTWLLIMGYAVSVRRRMTQLEEELERRAR